MSGSATLPKSERLSSERRIEALFNGGRRGYVHPLKYCWLAAEAAEGDEGDEATVSVMFSVPKKAFKRAWKRNLIKRRIKESYRRRKEALVEKTAAHGRRIDIAFICSADEIPDFKTIDHAVERILEQILARS